MTPTKKYKTLTSSIHSVYRLINSTFELKEFIARLTKLVSQIFHADYCLIELIDTTKQFSTFKCIISHKRRIILDKKEKITKRLERNIIKANNSVKKLRLLGLPFVSEDIVGLVAIKRGKKAPPFDEFDQQILTTINELATIGIKNLQLYEEQEKIVIGSIKSLVTMLDTRVPQEYTHSPYFSRIVIAIANTMHLDEKQINILKYASLLHDTGKADIPLGILTKTTKLTTQEYNIIKSHPVKGAKILRHLQILRPAIPIIMYHHEKYDGTGYPSRLKKNQIPLGARIMAVADAFEAMVYGRPYRERLNVYQAINEIKKKSGTQFDPKIVEAFLKIAKRLKSKNYITQKNK